MDRIEAKLDQVIVALVDLLEALKGRDDERDEPRDMESGGLDAAPQSL